MQQTHPAANWHAERKHLNHDWLKNRLIVNVGAALNLARGDFRNPQFETFFFESILPEWEVRRAEVEKWGRETETALSPSGWLAYRPLSSLPESTRAWLGTVAHELWLREVPVKAWVRELESALRDADERYHLITDLVPPSLAYGRRDLEHALDEFRTACDRLAATLSSFPRQAGAV